MINKQRLATTVLALGLGLTSLPAVGWAAPISLESGAMVTSSWSQSTSGDLGVTLVDLFAFVADNLSYYLDAAASEAYLGTACDPPC